MKKYLAVFKMGAKGFRSRINCVFQCKERNLKKNIKEKRDTLTKDWKFNYRESAEAELSKLYELIEITHKVFEVVRSKE